MRHCPISSWGKNAPCAGDGGLSICEPSQRLTGRKTLPGMAAGAVPHRILFMVSFGEQSRFYQELVRDLEGNPSNE